MTPAVTAIALIRFAKVDMSMLARIGHATDEETGAAGHVLDGVDKRAIHFYFDRRRLFRHGRGCRHRDGCRGRGFSSLFLHGNKGLVENLGDIQVTVRLSWRDAFEVRAAARLI